MRNLTLNLIRESGRTYHAERGSAGPSAQRTETTRLMRETGDPMAAFRAAHARNAAHPPAAEAAAEARAASFVTGAAQYGSDVESVDGVPVRLGSGFVSARQAAWIIDICVRRELPPITVESVYRNLKNGFNRRAGSEFIDRFRALPLREKAVSPLIPGPFGTAAPKAEGVTEDGIYVSPLGEIFKVQFNKAAGSGRRLYAKQLTISAPEGILGEWIDETKGLLTREKVSGEDHSWDYQGGLIKRILPEWKLTAEQAKAFGDLYGQCIRCHRELTDEMSIATGMGRICRNK